MRRIIEYFTREDQDKKLLKNIELYEQEEKTKQQKSEILGQQPVNRKANTEKSIDERG